MCKLILNFCVWNQPPIELLRQLLAVSGWFDRDTLEWKSIIDWSLVIACGPPGGGRNPMSERFKRYFNTICYTAMDDANMVIIFNTILSNSLSTFNSEVQDMCLAATEAAIGVYNETLLGLLPTPAKSHYTFNLRDLAKVTSSFLS